jgi:XTP/dITP diphosphohydrolase
MVTLILATRNLHKAQEIRAILGAGYECLTLEAFPGAPEVVEDATTFAGNATKKSVQLARWFAASPPGPLARKRSYVLADDSGLEVDALNGAPGVHSARFAALDTGAPGNSATTENNQKLLRLMQNVPRPRRTARFCCVLALTPILKTGPESASPVCAADEFELQTELFEGTCEGEIGFSPGGNGGFGYDPLFLPTGFEQTFSELGEEIKNRISHRAKALEKFRKRNLKCD